MVLFVKAQFVTTFLKFQTFQTVSFSFQTIEILHGLWAILEEHAKLMDFSIFLIKFLFNFLEISYQIAFVLQVRENKLCVWKFFEIVHLLDFPKSFWATPPDPLKWLPSRTEILTAPLQSVQCWEKTNEHLVKSYSGCLYNVEWDIYLVRTWYNNRPVSHQDISDDSSVGPKKMQCERPQRYPS